MALAFSASQQLTLALDDQGETLSAYLRNECRVVEALLGGEQVEPLGSGLYRYTVAAVQLFQLHIQPIIVLQVRSSDGRLELEALEGRLEGFGLVDDFSLSLQSWLQAGPLGLNGEAGLAISVSRPALLKLIPERVLEASGRSVLAGILLGIRTRVAKELLNDFQQWQQRRSSEATPTTEAEPEAEPEPASPLA
ncbi:MAG: DUF1997 domain-containing protein [Synechococcaceae cyanobacterium]|nr:DUF1997 domain-containing protein [Synechococcaceae cyanobacterium]